MRLKPLIKHLHIPKRLFTRFRRLLVIGSVLCTLLLVAVGGVRAYSAIRANGDIYTLDTAPERPVAIIFGALVNGDGTPHPLLADRVKAGADLYKAGKVKVLLMTGDNHIDTYNEPEGM